MPDIDRFKLYLESLKLRLTVSGVSNSTILLVTCIDLRYPGLIHKHMEESAGGYFHKKYDQLALAGAGLAGVLDAPPHPKPSWRDTFIEHVALSKKLHNISAVIVLEHRTCGAYKEFGLLRDGCTPEEELQAHNKQVGRLKSVLDHQFPDIMVDFFLLDAEPEKDKQIRLARLGV